MSYSNTSSSAYQIAPGSPVVGIGIDLVNDSPYINELLYATRGLFDYVEVFDGGDRDLAHRFAAANDIKLPILYHNPVLNLCGDELAPDARIDDAADCAAILRADWCVEEMGYNRIPGYNIPYFMPAVLTKECALRTVGNLRRLGEHFNCPVTPETPAFEVVFGDLTLSEFVRTIVGESGTQIVLDLTHILSYAHAVGDDLMGCCWSLPLDHVVEVHLAGGAEIVGNEGAVFRDTHGAMKVPSVLFRCLEELLPKMPSLRAVTVEVDGGPGAYAYSDLEATRRIMEL